MPHLTRDFLLHAAGKPEGFHLLWAFLNELEAGTISRTPTVTALANAFRQILDAKDGANEAAKALNLVRRRGQHFITGAQVYKRYGKIVTFIERQLEAEKPEERRTPRGALERAIAAACKHFHKDRRSIQRAWKHHAYLYAFSRENRWACALMKRYLTNAEFDVLKDAPGQIAIRIAWARERGKPHWGQPLRVK